MDFRPLHISSLVEQQRCVQKCLKAGWRKDRIGSDAISKGGPHLALLGQGLNPQVLRKRFATSVSCFAMKESPRPFLDVALLRGSIHHWHNVRIFVQRRGTTG